MLFSLTKSMIATSKPLVPEGSQREVGQRESRLRLRVATVMLVGMFDLIFGAAWDGQWLAAVGRDQFFTPPHIMLYSGVAIVGLLCLAMVLIETIRYHRHVPGVDDQTTTCVLRIFHAPLGFIITGFGMFMILLAAPLDNYWHILYGIDVTVWSPFHMMGLLRTPVVLAMTHCSENAQTPRR